MAHSSPFRLLLCALWAEQLFQLGDFRCRGTDLPDDVVGNGDDGRRCFSALDAVPLVVELEDVVEELGVCEIEFTLHVHECQGMVFRHCGEEFCHARLRLAFVCRVEVGVHPVGGLDLHLVSVHAPELEHVTERFVHDVGHGVVYVLGGFQWASVGSSTSSSDELSSLLLEKSRRVLQANEEPVDFLPGVRAEGVDVVFAKCR